MAQANVAQGVDTLVVSKVEKVSDNDNSAIVGVLSGDPTLSKLRSYFAKQSFDAPHLCIDLDRVAFNYAELEKALPKAEIY